MNSSLPDHTYVVNTIPVHKPFASSKKFTRLAQLVEKQYQSVSSITGTIAFALRTKDGPLHVFGGDEPVFSIILNNEHGITALSTLDQNTIVDAYLAGDIDLAGDIMQVLALRELFN